MSPEARPTLRDCPFCHTLGTDDEKLHFMGNLVIGNDCDYIASYSIFCTGCGVDLHDEYKDDLVNRWNGVKPSEEQEDDDD